MGLGQGMPKSVPVVESDFIFSAIAEEMGVIFCIFLILIYISSFIMFVNIALKMKKNFYKLCAFGLSVVLIFSGVFEYRWSNQIYSVNRCDAAVNQLRRQFHYNDDCDF